MAGGEVSSIPQEYVPKWRANRPISLTTTKKLFVCPFPTNPTFWKTRVIFFFFIFYFFITVNFAVLNKIVETKCHIVTVPQRHFNLLYWNITTSNTRIKPILELCMPKKAHTWMTLAFLLCIELKKKKKKKKKTLLILAFQYLGFEKKKKLFSQKYSNPYTVATVRAEWTVS